MMEIPKRIKSEIGEAAYELDTVGMSGSTIMLFEDKILKIEDMNEESDNQLQMMRWLQGKLPVPKVLCHETQNDKSFLLMSKIPGVMSCDEIYMADPEKLTAILAEGLKMLWQVDVSGCPCDCRLDEKLRRARYNVEHDLVDVDNVEPETFGEGGFASPAHLLEWLTLNKPEEECVLSHGDFCLPNIFVDNGQICGFIDLGRAGVADKYQDIALCYRSLKHNFEGKYNGGRVYENFRPERLFEKLGIEPDWEKIRYYILLDELF